MTNPIELIKALNAGTVDPTTLTRQQRRAVLTLLADGKQPARELAAFLKVSRKQINYDLSRIRREAGKAIANWDVATALGYLEEGADRSYAGAVERQDWGLANQIRVTFVRTLKELGLLRDQDSRDGVRVTFEMLGAGYERAADALARAMDPVLTGEVVEARTFSSKLVPATPALPMELQARPSQGDLLGEDLESDPAAG